MKFKSVAIAIWGVVILLVILIPMPTVLMDVLFIINITISLLILLNSIYAKDALSMSSFPTLLLFTTLYRLALNIAATRLIIGQGNAGKVVESFGEFVGGNNIVVGAIIFLVIMLVQFLVITKGAERVSEVAARFTLDAMPGKQMAVDADLNAGLINEAQAKERRKKIQREADFYGAMDGASKFVRGDAIAGIIIVIINIIGGLIIGMVQRGMTASEAVGIYTILTVGDGLVTQIPALLISTATGIVVTRSASQSSLGKELSLQVLSYPKALGLAALILFALGTIGLPRTPMYVLGAFFALLFLLTSSAAQPAEKAEITEDVVEAEQIKRPENVMELLQVEKMEMELGYGLIPLVDADQGGDLLDRIVMIRRQCAVELGFIVPPIRIRDNMQLKPNSYLIKIKGAEIASGELLLDNYLAIGPDIENDLDLLGVDTVEPAFNLPARWINTNQKDQAEMKGYTVVDPPSVLATHLTSVIKSHSFELLGRQEVQNMVDYVKEQNPAVVTDLIPDLISLSELQKVLSNLLREQVSIRDFTTILETLADYGRLTKDTDVLTEYVRQALRRQITRQYAGEDRKLQVLTLDPAVEDILRGSIQQSEFGSYLAVDPEIAQSLINKVSHYHEDLIRKGTTPIILCAPILRIYFKRLLDRFISDLVVLSYNEIDSHVQVEVVGMVTS